MVMLIRLALVVGALLVAPLAVTDALAQQCPSEIPAYALAPRNWACPIGRPICSTTFGACYYPRPYGAGTPCYCQAPNGVWIGGVVHGGPTPLYPGGSGTVRMVDQGRSIVMPNGAAPGHPLR